MKIFDKISQKIRPKKEIALLEKMKKHQFGLFIAGSLAVTAILLGVSLWMYNEFGTAQLDLSRPSLQEARDQAKRDAEKAKNEAQTSGFSGEGEINTAVLNEFEKLYSEKLNKLEGDFFGEGALSDETLNLTSEQQGENQ
jgi:hypothetical protein